MENLRPFEISLGNFISCFGEAVVVKGITPREDGSFYISHTGMKSANADIFGNGIEFDAYPIILNDEWKSFLKIDKRKTPKWIKYVHEAQQYYLVRYKVMLLSNVDFHMMPTHQDLSTQAK